MITLALDASTYVGTVAVFHGSRLVAETSAPMRGRDAERLMPAVDAALRQAGRSVADVQRVVCGEGPGSFTSLRIAASIAKGIAVGRQVPLFAVSSLALVVAGNVVPGSVKPARYLAILDALRGEWYAGLFEHREWVVQLAPSRRMSSDQLNALAAQEAATVVGVTDGRGWAPHARGALTMNGVFDQPVELGSWEPTYGRPAEAEVKLEAERERALGS